MKNSRRFVIFFYDLRQPDLVSAVTMSVIFLKKTDFVSFCSRFFFKFSDFMSEKKTQCRPIVSFFITDIKK
jgi:hypothetical protein